MSHNGITVNIKNKVNIKKIKVNKNINLQQIFLFLSTGFRIILIYMFFIFFIGDMLAKLLHLKNLYFLAIILGTIANINSILKIIEGIKNAK